MLHPQFLIILFSLAMLCVFSQQNTSQDQALAISPLNLIHKTHTSNTIVSNYYPNSR